MVACAKGKRLIVSLTNIRISHVNKVAFRVSCPWTRMDTLQKTRQSAMKTNLSCRTPRKRRDAKKNTGGTLRPSADGKRPKQLRGDAWKSRDCRLWRGGFGKKAEGRNSWRRKERKRRQKRKNYN